MMYMMFDHISFKIKVIENKKRFPKTSGDIGRQKQVDFDQCGKEIDGCQAVDKGT